MLRRAVNSANTAACARVYDIYTRRLSSLHPLPRALRVPRLSTTSCDRRLAILWPRIVTFHRYGGQRRDICDNRSDVRYDV